MHISEKPFLQLIGMYAGSMRNPNIKPGKKMEKENKYVLQYPSIMKGKKIMYVHGFMSSAQSGTVARIREMLPSADVVAYDLPVHPQEAMDLLRQKCEEQKPDLIIGTSMGGMYTEMLYGYDRILVNPAFLMGETMTKHGMLGKQTFQNPRQDGVQEFIVTKSLVEEYKEVTRQCFAAVTDEEQDRVYGLFGDADTTVAAETYGVFAAHYRQAISFHGEHRLIDKSLIHAVIPVVRWIDDRQEGRERPIVYVSIDALRDARGSQRGSAMKGFQTLLNHYAMYVVAPSPSYDEGYVAEVRRWVNDTVNVPAWQRLTFTNQENLLYGDYLIAPVAECERSGFMGTTIALGSDTFKTWDEIIEFFSRLGGQ